MPSSDAPMMAPAPVRVNDEVRDGGGPRAGAKSLGIQGI